MKLLDAIGRKRLDHPPVWFMRQAGRYLPEYRDLRARYPFQEAIHRPEIAAEITLQPWRRFDVDAAIVFSDIMTPLEGLGVDVEFTPGPHLEPMTIGAVADLADFEPGAVGFVAQAIDLVRHRLPADRAVIGFAGAPVTLAAYLLEGGGSKTFLALRRALLSDPDTSTGALAMLGRSMHTYLAAQIAAGADVVMLFDSWAGILSRDEWERFALPAARLALDGLDVPTIYFAPHAAHLLDGFPAVGADAYGVDWRLPLDESWRRIGTDHAIQGNLDPAVLLTDPGTVRDAVHRVLDGAAGRPGHIFNLGHGIDRATPVENVEAMIAAVREDRP